MSKIHGKILEDGTIALTDNQRFYLQKYKDKEVLIEIDESQNRELRAFFEVIVQYFYYQHPKANWGNFGDCREAIKIEFNPLYTTDKDGKSITTGGSTTGSKKKLQVIIDKLSYYFQENGLLFPENEEFKNFRDTNTDINAVYPPILKLKEKYNKEIKSNLPKWRQ